MNKYLTEFDELMDKAVSKLSAQEFKEFCKKIFRTMKDDYNVDED